MMKKGSLTIELSLIMPVILGLFVVMIFTGFILHDKCIVNKACLSAALRGSQETDDAKAMDMAGRAISEVIPGRLLCKWTYDTSVDVGEDEVRVSFKGTTGVTGGLAGRLLENKNTVHDYECNAGRLNRADHLRKNKQ
ncbi:MAG: pilus assembly protein [Lachnospiraceae bacterium]|nr:pilus assembly protein [Lachnospiraceae bacterium]MBR6470065.1 pilus assembly protein [Lachnospiraceae bacterium]MBR6485903.1 pilus assembly protein [Lachnospiraceae bacterium]